MVLYIVYVYCSCYIIINIFIDLDSEAHAMFLCAAVRASGMGDPRVGLFFLIHQLSGLLQTLMQVLLMRKNGTP